MTYFESSFHQFFKDLAANNNREWFKDHKQVFENQVKIPFHLFTEKVIEKVKILDSSLSLQVKDAVFRIYRDIRFSKDKTPYKLHMAAVVSQGGRKGYDYPGVYYHFGPGNCFIGSGYYFIQDKQKLYMLRKRIALNPKKVKILLEDKNFKKFYPEGILGDKNKVLPKELKEGAEKQPLIYNKQFYYMAEYKDDIIYRKDLIEFVVSHLKSAKKWNEFLFIPKA